MRTHFVRFGLWVWAFLLGPISSALARGCGKDKVCEFLTTALGIAIVAVAGVYGLAVVWERTGKRWRTWRLQARAKQRAAQRAAAASLREFNERPARYPTSSLDAKAKTPVAMTGV